MVAASNGVRASGHPSKGVSVDAAFVVEAPAVGVRERLVGFVAMEARGLPHPVQRENAELYVRGLVEQGGRKSLWPTLFRLEQTPAR